VTVVRIANASGQSEPAVLVSYCFRDASTEGPPPGLMPKNVAGRYRIALLESLRDRGASRELNTMRFGAVRW
jgi:hypothetical protein